MGYSVQIRVRYNECDVQGIAFATILYVNVEPGTKTPTPVPDHVRAALT